MAVCQRHNKWSTDFILKGITLLEKALHKSPVCLKTFGCSATCQGEQKWAHKQGSLQRKAIHCCNTSFSATNPVFNPIFKHLHSTHNTLLRLQAYCTWKMLTYVQGINQNIPLIQKLMNRIYQGKSSQIFQYIKICCESIMMGARKPYLAWFY